MLRVHAIAVFLLLPASLDAVPPEAVPIEEVWLKHAGVPTTNAGLTAFLKAQAARQPVEIGKLIQQLGSDNFTEREEASRNLIALGTAALPALKVAQKSADAEVVQRATACIEAIDKGERENWGDLTCLAIRLLGRRAPADALDTLLTFLPAAVPGQMEEEVWHALDAIAGRADIIPPALLKALAREHPARRAVAACIVGRRGDGAQKAAVRKLLEDREPAVRLRAAQGLLAGGDTIGVPALIALLDQPAVELAWQAEELLRWLAGETAPEAVVGAGEADSRKRCREAWETWRKQYGDKADPLKGLKEPRRPRLMLVCVQSDDANDKGHVYLCGCDGRARWRLNGLARVNDALFLPGPRILTAESATKTIHVREHDLAGNAALDHEPNLQERTAACLRLANGNLLLAGSHQLMEKTLGGKVVRERHHIHSNLRGLGRRGDGKAILLNPISPDQSGVAIWELDSFNPAMDRRAISLGRDINRFDQAQVEPLANGHYLVYGRCLDQLLEIDAQGKTVWQAQTGPVVHAVPLAGGTVLVASENRLCEIDRAGQAVWHAFPEGEIQRVRVCLGLITFGFPPATTDVDRSARHSALALRNSDVAVRRRALRYLKDLPRLPVDAVDTVTPSLGDGDLIVRRLAAMTLQRLGPRAQAAAAGLVNSLDDPEEQRQWRTFTDALVNIGLGAGPAVCQALKEDGRPRVRGNAAGVLAELALEDPNLLAALLVGLEDSAANVRRKVVVCLGSWHQPDPRVAATVIKALTDADVGVQRSAVDALARLGPLADPALPQLRQLLTIDNRDLRWSALKEMGRIGARQPGVLPDLLRFLQDRNNQANRLAAANALGLTGANARKAILALAAMLNEPASANPEADSHKRTEAAWALARIAPHDEAAVKALVDYLRGGADTSVDFRRKVLRAMLKLGAAGKEAVPLLLQFLRDDDTLGAQAILPLAGIGPEAVPGLQEVLEKGSTDSRLRALAALAGMGPAARPALPALIELLDGPDRSLRDEAAHVVGSIGPAAKAAVPSLLRLVQLRANPHLIEPLAQVGPEDRRVTTTLLEIVRNQGNPLEWRTAAARGLGLLGPTARDAVPVLVELVQSGSPGRGSAQSLPLDHAGRLDEAGLVASTPNLRTSALLALRALGPAAKDAQRMLVRLCENREASPFERLVAAEALERIGLDQAGPDGLLAALKEETTPALVRVAIIRALAAMGEQAKSAVPVLEDAVTQGERPVRLAARAALIKLRR